MSPIFKNKRFIILISSVLVLSIAAFLSLNNNTKQKDVFAAADCVSGGGVTCTASTDGLYTVNKYTLSGDITGTTTWTVPAGVTSVEYLVIGGGGSGGVLAYAGGGGAGAYKTSTGFAVSGTLTVTVGAGGVSGAKGSDSVFSSVTSEGGGYGASSTTPAGNGGSGGGASDQTLGVRGTATNISYGNNGASNTNGIYGNAALGGGGAGSAGKVGVVSYGGIGGDGLSSSITGTSVIYAAGGTGSAQYSSAGGSSNVGGRGAGYNTTTTATAGAANTGSGGGGGIAVLSLPPGAGGSGVVIVRYLTPPILILSYRKPMTINNTSTASILNNYQVSFTTDTAALVSAGKMKADCSDMRFTDNSASYNTADWTNNYSYWIESGCNTTTTKVWVKVDTIPASASKMIYMYYGNVSAIAFSNGSNTFSFFDDFGGTSIDASKWTITDATGWSVAGGELKGISTTGRLSSIQTFSSGNILQIKSRAISLPSNGYMVGGFYVSASNGIGELYHPGVGDYYRNDTAWTTASTVSPLSTNLLTKILVKSASEVNTSVTNYSTGVVYQGQSGACAATGGTITQVSGYCIHTFTSGGTFTPAGTMNVDYLVVAGGGGGGRGGEGGYVNGGGGGAGGLLTGTLSVSSATTVTVGTGGSAGASQSARGTNGTNSTFGATVTALGGGGGGGGYATTTGLSGGSGGGGGVSGSGTGGAGTSGQGNAGGNVITGCIQSSPGNCGGGGGGGAGGAGGTGGPYPGAVGPGFASSITGTSVTYATGGSGDRGSTAGTANSGNGGMAGDKDYVGAVGGSGIVVVRYLPLASITNTVSAEPIVLGKRYDDLYSGQAYEAYWDWMLVRQYVALEPIVTLGSESANYLFTDRGVVTINNANASILTNYQVSFTTDTAALVSAGKMKADCSDMRFTDNSASYNTADWTNNYSYWIESGCNTTTTKVWVKVDTIPASASKTIYMYYGNVSAVSAASGDDTFDFFDDFTGSSINLTKWDQPWTVGTYPVSSSILTLTYGSSTGPGIRAKTAFATNTAIRSKINYTTAAINGSFGLTDIATATYGAVLYSNYPTAGQFSAINRNPYPTESSTAVGSAHTGWKVFDIARKGSASTVFQENDTTIATLATNVPAGSLSPYVLAQGQNIQVDWILVRKTAAIEPTVSFTFSYRSVITITNANASILTNYQVSFTTDTAALVSAGKMKADCSDMRFTDNSASYNTADWTNNYSYWIESGCNTTTTKVWVKVDTIPASASKMIYMYYGNVSAIAFSNGSNTFSFFDDFGGTSIDASKWTITDATGWSVAGGELKGTNGSGMLTSKSAFSSGVVQEVKSRYITTPAGLGFQVAGFYISTSNAFGVLNYSTDYYRSDAAWVAIATPVSRIGLNLLTKIKVKSPILVDLTMTNYNTGASYQSVSGIANAVSSEPIVLGRRYDNGGTGSIYEAYWDWIFIRQYVALEPTVTVISVPPTATSLTVSSESSSVSSSVTSSCSGTTILKLSDALGGHAGSFNSSAYANNLCLSGVSGLGTNPSGASFLKLYDGVNGGHVEKTSESQYATNAYLSSSLGSVSCSYSSGSCLLGTTCIASISGDTNAHIGGCSVFDTKVCCSIPGSADNSSWYCNYYFDSGDVLQTGKDGRLDFQFIYNGSALSSGYRVAIGTSSDVGSATVVSPTPTTWLSSGSVASGSTITYSGTYVKNTPTGLDIGYGNGSTPQTYYWWVKVKDANSLESDWIPGGTFTTPKKHYPIVRVAANKTDIKANSDVQYCAGTDLTNQATPALRDACYSVCWTGTAGSAVVDPLNANWKCSVCYDSSGNPTSCSTLNDGDTTFTWKIPSFSYPSEYTLVSGTLTSANPIIKYKVSRSEVNTGLKITGSACGNQSGDFEVKVPTPTWKEISPF